MPRLTVSTVPEFWTGLLDLSTKTDTHIYHLEFDLVSRRTK
jgi:hypothetical protein